MHIAIVPLLLQVDVTQNLLQESLDVFETIISYPWFQDSFIILFMNKTDLFMEKIRKSPISSHFPEYKGNCLCMHAHNLPSVGVDKLKLGGRGGG